MRYEDFVLHIGPDQGRGYPVHAESPAGRGSGVFRLPFDPREPRRHLPTSGVRNLSPLSSPESEDDSTEVTPPPSVAPLEIGNRLFRALFTDRVRQLFDQSWGRVQSVGGEVGLRIQIRLDPEEASTARLAELPWELLYQEETRQFLNLSRRSPVSRELVVPRPPRPLVFPTPLRLVAVTVNPPGTDPLQLDRERELLRAALEDRPTVRADFPRVTTAAELRRALRRKRYHALHFMGHGQLDERRREGTVLFQDQHGGLDAIPGGAFADEVRDCESLRLVVLNACSTGRWGGDGADPFAGVASALILSGLPAVLAMQAPISDGAAIAFSQELYQHLAEGDPVDAAVVEGRLAIQRQARADDTDSEWATPALFLRSGGGAPNPAEPIRADQEEREDSEQGGNERRGRHERSRGIAVLVRVLLVVALAASGIVGYLVTFQPELVSRETPAEEERMPRDTGTADATSKDKGNQADSFSSPDIQALQKPPFRSDAVATFIRTPGSGSDSVDTSDWLSVLESKLKNRMRSLHLDITDKRNAAWLVVLAIESPRVEAADVMGRAWRTCHLRARFELYHRRSLVRPMESLGATGGAFTPEDACAAGLEKLANQVGQRLGDAFLSS